MDILNKDVIIHLSTFIADYDKINFLTICKKFYDYIKNCMFNEFHDYELIIKTNYFHGFQNGPMYGFGSDKNDNKYIYLLNRENMIIDKDTYQYIYKK